MKRKRQEKNSLETEENRGEKKNTEKSISIVVVDGVSDNLSVPRRSPRLATKVESPVTFSSPNKTAGEQSPRVSSSDKVSLTVIQKIPVFSRYKRHKSGRRGAVDAGQSSGKAMINALSDTFEELTRVKFTWEERKSLSSESSNHRKKSSHVADSCKEISK